MPGEMKLTLSVTDQIHARLEEIASEAGITTTELLRRGIGLLSVTHTLLQESGEDMYICSKDREGAFSQQHVLSNVLY